LGLRPVAARTLSSDVLRTLRVRGSVYFCDRLEPPWSLEFHDQENASFHLVRRGTCWVRAGDEVERLGSGDLVTANTLDPGSR